MRMGRFSLRPHASIEYYKLTEKGYTESGGGGAFDLTVRKRVERRDRGQCACSRWATISAATLRRGLMRFELEGGRREILSGKLGTTTASFGDGDPFTLIPSSAPAAGAAPLRFLAGGSPVSVAVEVNAEEQQSKLSIGGRVCGQLPVLGRGGAARPPLIRPARLP